MIGLNIRLKQAGIFSWQAIAFVACYLLIVLRLLPRLQAAYLYAEDGGLFLEQAFTKGYLTSIITPYDGYYHVIPRILILAAFSLSIDYLPHIIILVTSLIYALVASLILREDYAYIIPQTSYRFVIAIAFCLLPGTWEIIGNACTLHSVLFLLLLMWGISSLDSKTTWWQATVAFVICASAGEVIVLLPLFIARIILQNRQDRNFISKPDLAIVFSILSWSIINAILSAARSISSPFSLKYFQFLSLVNGHRLILRPLLGYDLGFTIVNLENKWLFYLIVLPLGFYGIKIICQNFNQNYILLMFGILSSLAIPALTFIVRPHSLGELTWFQAYHRTAFLGAFFGPVVIGLVLFHTFKNPKMRKYVLIGYLALTIAGCGSHFWLGPQGKQQDWSQATHTIKKVLQTGCPPKARIPLNPPEFNLVVQNPSYK